MAKLTYEAERRVEKQRLVYYLSAADASFWERHWQTHLSPETYATAERGHLGRFDKTFIRYLPSQGRILEAGLVWGSTYWLYGRGVMTLKVWSGDLKQCRLYVHFTLIYPYAWAM